MFRKILSNNYIKMSSSRSNASARQRRTADISQIQRQPQQFQQHQIKQNVVAQPAQPVATPHPKMSVSDAIALTTLRLGRVEQIINSLPSDLTINTEQNNGLVKNIMERLNNLEKQANTTQSINENSSQPNNIEINNLINRINMLEKQQLGNSGNNNQLLKNITERLNNLEMRQVNYGVNNNVTNSSLTSIDTEEITTKINNVNKTITDLKDEINKLKDMLLALQTYTMTTNKQLSDLVLFENNNDVITSEIMDQLRQSICDTSNNYDTIQLDITNINDESNNENNDTNNLEHENDIECISGSENEQNDVSDNAGINILATNIHDGALELSDITHSVNDTTNIDTITSTDILSRKWNKNKKMVI